MNKFKVTLYPNVDSYICKIEADTIDDAIEIAEEEANQNCSFIARQRDVEKLED